MQRNTLSHCSDCHVLLLQAICGSINHYLQDALSARSTDKSCEELSHAYYAHFSNSNCHSLCYLFIAHSLTFTFSCDKPASVSYLDASERMMRREDCHFLSVCRGVAYFCTQEANQRSLFVVVHSTIANCKHQINAAKIQVRDLYYTRSL